MEIFSNYFNNYTNYLNSYSTLAICVVLAVILLLFKKLLILPIKLIFKVGYKILLGGTILYIINIVGSILGFGLHFNPLSALLVGALGLPGLCLVAVFNYGNLL